MSETHEHYVQAAVEEPTPTSNIEKYLKDHPMDLSVFKSMREVNTDFKNACRRIAEDFQVNHEVVETRMQWYTHLARKKLHQGKKWSRGLVDALIIDITASRDKYLEELRQGEIARRASKVDAEPATVAATDTLPASTDGSAVGTSNTV